WNARGPRPRFVRCRHAQRTSSVARPVSPDHQRPIISASRVFMPFTPGTRWGVYEIVALLGSGSMGEVYRARDTRLHRDVAIKVLRSSVAGADRLARFEREARLLASPNHPNIAHIHGFEDTSGV